MQSMDGSIGILGGSFKKTNQDAMSRKSTAFSNSNSEMGTPGSMINNEKSKRNNSIRGSRGSG